MFDNLVELKFIFSRFLKTNNDSSNLHMFKLHREIAIGTMLCHSIVNLLPMNLFPRAREVFAITTKQILITLCNNGRGYVS